MKDFTRPPGRLRALPFHARLTYSIFLIFTLLALALTAWLGADMLEPDLSGFGEYYAGQLSATDPDSAFPAAHSGSTHTAEEAASPAASSSGPILDLPVETRTPRAADPIPLRKLLEVTHFHIFSMPVYLMIVSHLFMLSTLGPRAKTLWIALGTAGVLTHVAAPWLARTPGSGPKWFYAASGSLLAASFLMMSAVPLLEMWRSLPKPR